MNQNSNKETDLRVVKTKKAIFEAFSRLLKLKSYSKITVSDIVKEAQINRNTFYLHYYDKDDLLENICFNNLEKYEILVIDKINEYRKNKKDRLTEDEVNNLVKEIMFSMSKEIQTHKNFLKDPQMHTFVFKIKEHEYNKFKSLLSASTGGLQIYLDFFFEGIFGIFIRWVENGALEGPINYISTVISKTFITLFNK